MQSIFEILFLNRNPYKISKGEKAFLRENIICYISGMEGLRKLKFNEVGLQMSKFLKKKSSKKFLT